MWVLLCVGGFLCLLLFQRQASCFHLPPSSCYAMLNYAKLRWLSWPTAGCITKYNSPNICFNRTHNMWATLALLLIEIAFFKPLCHKEFLKRNHYLPEDISAELCMFLSLNLVRWLPSSSCTGRATPLTAANYSACQRWNLFCVRKLSCQCYETQRRRTWAACQEWTGQYDMDPCVLI